MVSGAISGNSTWGKVSSGSNPPRQLSQSLGFFAKLFRYQDLFRGHKPGRTIVAVRQKPLDALTEIECTAEFSD